MAVIEVSAEVKGEATTEAKAGLRMSASAHCVGRAAGGIGRRPPIEEQVPQTEPQSPKGK